MPLLVVVGGLAVAPMEAASRVEMAVMAVCMAAVAAAAVRPLAGKLPAAAAAAHRVQLLLFITPVALPAALIYLTSWA